MSPDAEEAYLRRQLIPYLGNKRSLLPDLKAVFLSLAEPGSTVRFLDAFSGSGAVARLARTLGYSVEANDWEPYSQALNRSWLVLTPARLEAAFGGAGKLRACFDAWNAMYNDPGWLERCPAYLARWYAPADTAHPDPDGERLFYTAENAAFLDAVRNRLDSEYPPNDDEGPVADARAALLGSALLEAAVHTNTSGVFKACHRGFGGHGHDALGRIMARMQLEAPAVPQASPGKVTGMDVTDFLRSRTADIAYLDPPYNQHQYGSNYHLLNTIVRWDCVPMPLVRNARGKLIGKGGIPDVWKRTSSPFCGKNTAKGALEKLIATVDARAIVMSYNGDGHVTAPELAAMLSERGRLELRCLGYTSYRGGRQSNARRQSSREYVFVVRTDLPSTGPEDAIRAIRLAESRDTALKGFYDPDKLRAHFTINGDSLVVRAGPEAAEPRIVLPLTGQRRLGRGAEEVLDAMGESEREDTLRLLGFCVCQSVESRLEILAGLAAQPDGLGRSARKEALVHLRKLAHPRHKVIFYRLADRFRRVADEQNDKAVLGGLDLLLDLADRRFAHTSDGATGDALGRGIH